MFFRRMIALGLVALLFVGVLGAFARGGQERLETAWTQGYLAGQQAAAADGAAVPAPAMPAYGPRYGHWGFFPGGLLFACLLPLFLIGFGFFLFGRRWRRFGQGHHGHGPWRGGHGPRHGHGDRPKWAEDPDWSDEPVMKA